MLALEKTFAPARRRAASSRLLTGLGLGVAAGFLVAGALAGYSARQDAWQQALRNSCNLLAALQQNVASNLQVFDLSLQGAQRAWAAGGLDKTPPTLLQDALFGPAAGVPGFGSIAVLSRDGSVAESSGAIPHGLDWSRRDEFAAHRSQSDLGLYVGRASRTWFSEDEPSIFLSRRIDSGGAFAGVVSAGIRLSYFEQLFSRMDVGPHGSIILLRTDGRIVWRYPSPDGDMDRDVSRSDVFPRLLAARTGQFEATSSIDGTDRLYRFARVGDLPLILSVNLSLDDIYARWRQKALIIGPVLTAMCAVVVLLTLLFQREMRRREAAEQALTKTAQELAGLASSDPLTALANRRALDEAADREWRRAVRTEEHLAVLMIDVDHFKSFNDTYGHQDGDQVLRGVCMVIKDSLRRPTDVAARYGGEEFAILLPGSDGDGARHVAERIRSTVEELAIPHTGSPFGRVTVSIGLASMIAHPDVGMSQLMAWADRELYRAKREGRNRLSGGGMANREPRRIRADAAAITG